MCICGGWDMGLKLGLDDLLTPFAFPVGVFMTASEHGLIGKWHHWLRPIPVLSTEQKAHGGSIKA